MSTIEQAISFGCAVISLSRVRRIRPHHDGVHLPNALEFAVKQGIPVLGHGVQGIVFAIGEWAVKVGSPGQNGRRFYRACYNKAFDSPHLPRISALQVEEDSELVLVVMERLQPITQANYELVQEAWYGVAPTLHWDDTIRSIAQTKAKLERLGAEALDLHDGNVMQRADGTIVLTDVCY